MAGYPAPEVGPWTKFPALRVYFDSGVHPPGRQPPRFVKLGYSVCRPEARSWNEAISSAASVCAPGKPVTFWGLRLERLTAGHRAALAASAAGRGPQLYDLVAAHGAAVGLRANGFHGSLEMLSDGSAVIQFMAGDDSSLSLKVGGMNFAQDLRAEILETLRGCASVKWRFVPRRENLADSAVRHLNDTLTRHDRRSPRAERLHPASRAARTRT